MPTCIASCACMLSPFSRVWVCETLWTVAHQAPPSMRFYRQEYWNGLPLPPPGDLPDPGIECPSLSSPALAGRLFTTSTTWEAHCFTWPSIKPQISVFSCPHCPLPLLPHLLSVGWHSISPRGKLLPTQKQFFWQSLPSQSSAHLKGKLSLSVWHSPHPLTFPKRPYCTHTKQAGTYYQHPKQGAQPPEKGKTNSSFQTALRVEIPSTCYRITSSLAHPTTPNSRGPLGCEKINTSLQDQFILRWAFPQSLTHPFPSSTPLPIVEADDEQWDIVFLPLEEESVDSEGPLPLGMMLWLNVAVVQLSPYLSSIHILSGLQGPSQKPQNIPNFLSSLISYGDGF